MKNYYSIFCFIVAVLCIRNYSAVLKAQNALSLPITKLDIQNWAVNTSNFVSNTASIVDVDFVSRNFLTMNQPQRFSYINPNSSETGKNLYSQNIALVLFATATRGNTQPISFEKSTLAPYAPSYAPTSSTRWYVGDRLFAVDNSAFFGIEFDSNFAYKSGVIRIGDSSEKAFVILVSLTPPKR